MQIISGAKPHNNVFFPLPFESAMSPKAVKNSKVEITLKVDSVLLICW